MQSNRFWRSMFVIVSCMVSLPWLTPCGVTAIPAIVIAGTDQGVRKIFGKRDSTKPTAAQLDSLSGRPSLTLVVRQDQVISRNSLISKAEWNQSILEKNRRVVNEAGMGAVDKAVDFLFRIDPSNNMQGSKPSEPETEPRKKLVVSTAPFVLLQADRLSFVVDKSKKLPVLAEALTNTMMANVTINTPDGIFFAAASRICYREGASEFILEGNPTVLSGRRQIKTAHPGALMKINFITRTVLVAGRAVETQL